MKKIAAITAAAVLTAGLAACTAAPAPVQTVAPAPTVTVTQEPTPEPEPVTEDNLAMSMLEIVWEDTSKSDREDMCIAYNIAPGMMWDSFQEGAEGNSAEMLTKADFYAFFDAHC